MKSFHCSQCGMMIFFENDRCLKCGHPLGVVPEVMDMRALEKVNGEEWQLTGTAASGKKHRSCANGKQYGICNWLVPAEDPNAWCVACRLNKVIPDLSDPKNLKRWSKVELAKRRCLYTLLKLGLPLESAPANNPPPLRFKFLQDMPNGPVKTGHENGVITINIAEADEDERERRRLDMREPYRTLIGHIRHESGHYYWDRLIASSPNLPGFRKLFGDDTANYNAALETYYRQGPPADWAARTVSAYASSHPWEDWAETWAHYLHIMDTLESAASFGLGMKDTAPDKTGYLPINYGENMDFDQLLAAWAPLTTALNTINRSMGLPDLYPFVIPPPVVAKLHFIHNVVLEFNHR